MIGGQQRNPIKGATVKQTNKGILKAGKLKPGQLVFLDQHVSSLAGQNFNKRGQTLQTQAFQGGTVFCDAASTCSHVENQIGFAAHETVQSKLTFEHDAAQVGIEVQGHCTDNGVHTSKVFGHCLEDSNQTIRHSGVGGHHHNGVAEN